MKKIWYCVCLLFCAYSMHKLIEERHSVGYVLSNRPESFRYLACYPIRNLTNRTELSLDELKEDMLQSFGQMKQKIHHYYWKSLELFVLNVTALKQYLIFNDRVCFTTNHYYRLWLFNEFCFDPPKYRFKSDWKFFAFRSDDYEFRTYEVVADRSTYVGLLVIYHKSRPYSNCRRGFSKYHCLNDCFKRGNRLSKYYYAGNETGRIRLDYDDESRSIVEHEINCTRLCRWESCKINYFLPSFVYNQTTTVFVAKPVITTLDYFVQLVGLLCLFTCSSLYQIALKLLQFAILKTEKEKLKRFVRYVQLANPLVCALFCVALYTQMALIHRYNLNNPTRKETTVTLFTPEIFHALVCISVDEIYGRKYKYENRTFAEFEQDTSFFFNQTVSEIYVNFQGKKHSVDWQLLPKTVFKHNQRCFLVRVLSNQEPKSQSILLASKLTFKFRHPIYLFLQTEAEISPVDPYVQKEYSFIKKIKRIIQDEKRCVNYKTKFNCRDQESCIGRCTKERIFKQFKHFGYGGIIDKDELSEEQWATTKAFPRFRIEEHRIYINASEECRLKYPLENCHEVVFEKGVYRPQSNNYTLELELYYEVVSRIEEQPSWYKLFLNALNIQTILFGLTVPKLFSMLLNFRKFNLGLKEKKVATFGVYLLCTVGFSLQTFYIFHEVVSGEMSTSQFYEIVESLKMPELVFCLPIDGERVDQNHRLTANYLDSISGDLTPETMFDRILYLKTSGEWNELSGNFTDENFKIKLFFFFSKKCILLRSNVLYERTNMRFHFKNQKILKILFNSELLYPNTSSHDHKKLILFFTKTEDSLQFSKMTYLKFENFKKIYREAAYKRVVRLSQESFFVNFDDKFNFFKNPLSLFYESNFNDVNSYLLGLIENRFRIGSLSLPKVIDDMEIDEDLFEQYFRQVQNVTDHSTPINPNYQREFATNYQTRLLTDDMNGFDFEFQLIHFKKIITTTNEDSFAKLILSLLNVLSIWFDLGILALHWYIDKLIQLPFHGLYRLLLKIHEMLWLVMIKEKMDSLRESNPKEEDEEDKVE